MRFLHAADVHLDSPLRGLSAYAGAPTELLRSATRVAFTRLIDTALEEEVDFLIIAGDLYDGDWKDFNTGIFFAREMGRLARAGIPAFVLYGNHDAESEITKQLTLPANVKTFSSRKAETHRLEALKVAIDGRSFREAATTENLAIDYPEPLPGWLNIGVLHTALEGDAAHATYAPCSVAQLAAKGYDYWALGHVHEHRVVSKEPLVVFPGNIQGRHARELGPRGVVLVTADENGIGVERRIVDQVRWAHVRVDASPTKSLEEVVHATRREIEAAVAREAEGRLLAVRVTIAGRTAAHGALFGFESQLRAEILAQAAALGDEVAWIEKVRIETLPDTAPETLRARADAMADLQGMLERAQLDQPLLDDIAAELADLVTRAPKALVDAVPALDALRRGEIASIVQAIAPSLIARLASETKR
jgi:DNA repair exonuclease SbcCD nuclease subunit